MMSKQTPLCLVFYIDRELAGNKQIMGILNTNLNTLIAEKGDNIYAWYLPTDGEERIECINPVLYSESDMEPVNKLIADIKAKFDIGQGADEGKLD